MRKIIFFAFVIMLLVIIAQTDTCKNFLQVISDVVDEARRDIVGVRDKRDNALDVIYDYYNEKFKKMSDD